MQSELTTKTELIGTLREKIILLEEIDELNVAKGEEKKTKKDGKTYSTDTRMIVDASIVNQVPNTEHSISDSNICRKRT